METKGQAVEGTILSLKADTTHAEKEVMQEYTAISFAPVQSFIEKSRKLRDLYGASLILSYLSFKLVQEASRLGLEAISPGLINVQEGMPNRILIKGKFERNDVQNTLLREWRTILKVCREFLEKNLGFSQYHWSQTEDQKGKQKGEWERWESYTWEVFWGYGESVKEAMEDLETRKLKRDWIAINWTGESSSLTGTDAIAWHQLGKEHDEPGRSLTPDERDSLELFYRRLSWLLDKPDERLGKPSLSLEQLRNYEKENVNELGKYIAPNERLSIPELTKRLVTYEPIASRLGMAKLKQKPTDPEFKDISREAGYWTGWFMGDGDRVGEKLNELSNRHTDDAAKQDSDIKKFTGFMRQWGKEFQANPDLFPEGKGRVIYAGGDDFLGVLYSEQGAATEKSEKIKPIEVLTWLITLPERWKSLQEIMQQELNFQFTYSVGFVWAGHQVPQRDILQHCRAAEKQAKSLGRDRVTLRVVFNSGQFVQWTCPWDRLDLLTKYRDRDGKTWGQNPNWTHIYQDWAELKARHAIQLKKIEGATTNRQIALSLLDLYFDGAGTKFQQGYEWGNLTGDSTDIAHAIVNWIDDLIQVGWQLCHNSKV